MTLQDLGDIGELVGAIGVVVSLVYLAVQIRQNTRSVRASSFQEALRDVNEVTDRLSADPELLRIFSKGSSDLESLDQEERLRFFYHMVGLLRRFEIIVYQTGNDALEEESWEGARRGMRALFAREGARHWWREARDRFGEDFQDFVEREFIGKR